MLMRRRLALALDVTIVLMLVVTIVILLTGGFFTRAGGFRISGRSPDRALLVAVALAVARLAIDRRSSFLRRSPGYWTRLRDRWFQHDADPAAASGATWSQLGLATLGISLVAAVLLYPQLRAMYSVPDLGDPLFSMWRMSWAWRQLRGDPRSLFDGNIFYPESLTLTYSDAMLLPSLTAAPLFALGVHPVLTYNLLFVGSFLFAGVATFALASRLTGSPQAAFIAGLIYGFYPYRFEHYSHLELQMTGWMPLALIGLHRFADRPRIGAALLFAGCSVAQLYSSMYYGVFFAIYAAVLGIVLFRAKRVPIGSALAPLGIAGALAVAAAMPLIRPYAAAQERKGDRDKLSVSVYSARATDFLRAHSRSARYGRITLPGREPERALFPGVTPIALSGIALVPPLGITRVAYASGFFIAFDASLGFNGISYQYLYDWFQPIRGMRVPARFSIIGALSLAVLGGFGVRRILSRRTGVARTLLFAGMVALVGIDLQPLIELEPVWRVPPPIYAAVQDPAAVLAEFPVRRDNVQNVPYMYFSFWHPASLVNGYSGFSPAGYEDFTKGIASFPEPSAIELLRARGATHVTVNCALYRDDDGCKVAMEGADTNPALRQIARGMWEGRPVALYELTK
jgi:hypothetical protein